MLEEFGEKRVRDTPISENTIVGMGVGAAMAGLRPIVEIMTVNFALLAMDQIINSAAHIHYMFGGQAKVPLVDPLPAGRRPPARARRTRTRWRRCSCTCPACWSRCRPRRPTRKGLLKAAIRDDNPVIFIEHEIALRHARRGARERRADALRRGGDPARGQRRDDRRHLAHGGHRRARRRDARRRRRTSRPR